MRSSRGLTLLLSLGLAALIIAGAGAAYAVGHLQRGAVLDGRATSGGPAGASGAGRSTVADAGSSTQDAVAPSSSDPGSDAAPAVGPTSSRVAEPVAVRLSPSAESSPHAQDVADLIARYFTSINRHDYDAWLATVSTAQAKRDRDDWTHDYSTTRDSDIYISDITAGRPLTVRMQFTSHQAIGFAPPQLPAECVRWDVTYQVVDEGVGLRVGTSAKPPAVARC